MELIWTKDAPTEEGYYWLHEDERFDIVLMEILSWGPYVQWAGTGDGRSISDYHDEEEGRHWWWYGPLKEPPFTERKEG